MPLTRDQAVIWTNRLAEEILARQPEVNDFEDHFDGRHKLAFMSDEFRKFHEKRYVDFSDNWCETVGRAAPERTEVYGLRLGDDLDVLSDDEKQLWRDWEVNDGPAQSSQGFLSSAICKRSYALVWGSPDDEPVLTWEHASQATVWYDDSGRIPLYGLKMWRGDTTEYATLYTADQVWKFSRPTVQLIQQRLVLPRGFHVGWELRDTGDGPNPMPNPLGLVPLVEFPNRPRLAKGPISDIKGTIAMQNAINLMWAYLFNAADFASMPARVVLGQEPPKMPVLDENGQKVGEKPVPVEKLQEGRLLYLTGQNAKIDSWEAAKLDVFTSVLNVMVKHLASQTRTPIHYIMGDLGNVNGETLTATELPLAYKVREGHKHLRHPMREVFRRMALVRGNEAVADQCRTAVVQFKNPETSSDAQTSDAALKDKQVGWPFPAILERRYGLSQPEIDRIMTMAENDPELQAINQLANGNQPPTVPNVPAAG